MIPQDVPAAIIVVSKVLIDADNAGEDEYKQRRYALLLELNAALWPRDCRHYLGLRIHLGKEG